MQLYHSEHNAANPGLADRHYYRVPAQPSGCHNHGRICTDYGFWSGRRADHRADRQLRQEIEGVIKAIKGDGDI